MGARFSARSLFWSLTTFSLIVGAVTPVTADIVSTSEALALEENGHARQQVDAYFAREEVAAVLTNLGVDQEVARLRAAALSPDELEELAARIEEAPAGGSALTVLGITFLVLLVLELVGVIDIFKKL